MNNKPMMNVELDLLKRLEASFSSAYACAEEFSYNDSDADAVLAELRELLGRPTPQYPLEGSGPETPRLLGDPVAVFSWDSTGYRAKLLLDHTKPFPADGTLLYSEQPAPVADHTQCEECKGWGYHENHHEGGGTECGECGGSGNATEAEVMVMPDRMKVEPFTTIDRGSKNYKAGYNAAIAEVASLKGVNK